MKIAGIVILYNPKSIEEIISNICTFSNHVDYIIVIDNSEGTSSNEDILKKKFDKLYYESFGENLGIAKALNTGCDKALSLGCTHVLTMDQDSFFNDGHFEKLIKTKVLFDDDFGILTPFHLIKEGDCPRNNDVCKIDDCITSGNILNLNAFLKVGGFLDKLFIDYVDFEFCGRLAKNGYLIYINNNSILRHQLGDLSIAKFLNKTTHTTNHSPVRRYYRTRNFFYFFKKNITTNFTNTILMSKNEIIDFVFLILFEKNRLVKIKFVILGLFDFLAGRYGKINSNLGTAEKS